MNKYDSFIVENDRLRNEWHESYGSCDDFIFDGATDPKLWFQGSRILCILKEAHGGETWNHAEAIRNDGGLLRVGGTANQATHNRMVEWLYAIDASQRERPVDVETDRSNGHPEGRAAMLRSAWINIKKANGVSKSDALDLRGVAERDASFLKRQLGLLSPRIVLCCGTFKLIGDLLFPDFERIPGTEISYKSGPLTILAYRHPLYASRESYQPLIEEIERLKNASKV